MRLNINLASLKYEDVRRFYMGWGVTVALLAALVAVLPALSYVKYLRTKASAQESRNIQQKIDSLERQRDQMAAVDRLPENRDVAQEKKYWNTQISKRAFSWTQLLNDMQRIMPGRAFLKSVQPELTPENRLKLQLTIIGEKRDDARELQKRMENSLRFSEPRIVKEDVEKESKAGVPPTFRFEIETFYNPAGPAISPPPAQKERGQPSQARLYSATEGM